MLALDVFAVSVRKVIGAYVALLGGVDLLVFTGGIGEHSEYVRSAAATASNLSASLRTRFRLWPQRKSDRSRATVAECWAKQ